MYCAKCGTALNGSPAFCSSCGAPAAAPGPAPTPGPAAAQAHEAPTALPAFEYFKRCMTEKYARFTGRARRREYWYFILFFAIGMFVLGLLDGLFGLADEEMEFGPLAVLGFVIAFIPSLAVQVRRLHDTNRSGWWILLNLIPLLGPLVLLVFMVLDSQPGENRYGANPKGA